MKKLRVATFNTENLFARYRYVDFKDADGKDKKWLINEGNTFSVSQKKFFFFQEKHFTAKAILQTNADVVCLQEVESLRVLEKFKSKFLKNAGYEYLMCIDSKDPRLISNAIISKYPIVSIKNHRDVKDKKGNYLFSRSPLEAIIDFKGIPIVIINCHLKSMSRGRNKTHRRRKEQANFISTLIDKRSKETENLIVLGDLNDVKEGNSAILSLINNKNIENLTDRLPNKEKWTHFCNFRNRYSLLDYVLVSKVLANIEFNKKMIPIVHRSGLPKRVKRYTGKRIKGIGMNYPKASDHCPMVIELQFEDKKKIENEEKIVDSRRE